MSTPSLRSIVARKALLMALVAMPTSLCFVAPTPAVAADEARKKAGDVSFVLPAGWTLDENPRPMRLATIVIGEGATKAEVVLSSLGGNFGGPAANVNRWRGMAGLPAVGEDEAKKALTPAKVGALDGMIFDAAGEGEAAKRVVVAFAEKDGKTWFFRLIGPAKTVTANREAFDKFVASLKFE